MYGSGKVGEWRLTWDGMFPAVAGHTQYKQTLKSLLIDLCVKATGIVIQ